MSSDPIADYDRYERDIEREDRIYRDDYDELAIQNAIEDRLEKRSELAREFVARFDALSYINERWGNLSPDAQQQILRIASGKDAT